MAYNVDQGAALMARYRRIDVRIHFDKRVERLSPIPPCGEGLWHYLLTNPDGTMVPGLARCGRAAMAEALGWDLEAFDKAFAEVFAEGLAEADWKARVVWVPNVIKYDPPGNPNVVLGWASHWDEIPDCDLKVAAWEALHSWFQEDSAEKALNPKIKDPRSFLDAFLKACPKPFGEPSAKPSHMRALRIPDTGYSKQEQEDSSLAHNSLPPLPLPPTHAREQLDGRKAGALPPEPPVARASDGSDGGSTNGGDADSERRRGSRLPLSVQATQPPPSSGRGGAPLPGEDELFALGETLWHRHPQGLRGGAVVGTQRALLELLRRGRIRPERSTGAPGSLTFSQLDERHAAWCAVWERGETKPMNLVTRWLGQCEFLDPPPANKAPPRNGNNATQRRWGTPLAPGTTEEDVRRAEEFDRQLYGDTS